MIVYTEKAPFSPDRLLIEELAYKHFVKSGRASGNALKHWLDAENELSKSKYERYESLIKSCDEGIHCIFSSSPSQP